ncbi:MAG: hypothetical protein QXQ60_07220 [Thermofilum sp.]
MSSQLLPVHEALRNVLGKNLSAVIAYGSMIRPEDRAQVSELNLLILVKEKVPAALRGQIAEMLGSNVSTIVLDLESFRRMVSEGEYLAHEVLSGGKVIYSDEEFENLRACKPPINERTLEYLRRHALACLALSIENLSAGRYVWSVNYAYRAVRSAARFYAACRGVLPFSDDEVAEALKPAGSAAHVFARVREARRVGVEAGELHELLASCYNAVLELLGYERAEWWEALRKVEALFVSDVTLREEGGVLYMAVKGVGKDKETIDTSVPVARRTRS